MIVLTIHLPAVTKMDAGMTTINKTALATTRTILKIGQLQPAKQVMILIVGPNVHMHYSDMCNGIVIMFLFPALSNN